MNSSDRKKSSRNLYENHDWKIKQVSELQALPQDVVEKLISAKGKLHKDENGKLIYDKKTK